MPQPPPVASVAPGSLATIAQDVSERVEAGRMSPVTLPEVAQSGGLIAGG